ncbi:MAG: hypothetical protein JST40_10215 [Armatimonadetes bacterium]|nr:hypothetical protein [Armatimonadota bacterium]
MDTMTGNGLGIGALIGASVTLLVLTKLSANQPQDSFRAPEMPRESYDQIKAYIEPVRLVDQLGPPSEAVNPQLVRSIADRWLSLQSKGLLQSPKPCLPDDTSRDGVRLQIASARARLGIQLSYVAHQEAVQGNTKGAVQDYSTAYRVFEVFKYADLTSVTAAMGYQAVIMDSVEKLAPEDQRDFVKLTPLSESWDSALRRISQLCVVEATFDYNPATEYYRQKIVAAIGAIRSVPFEMPAYVALRKELLALNSKAPEQVFGARIALDRAFSHFKQIERIEANAKKATTSPNSELVALK